MIVACGPESNGTKLLTRILETSGERVVHRSLPYGHNWWHYTEFPPGTRFVAIFRDEDSAVQSVLKAGHIEEPWYRDKRKRAYEEQKAARDSLAEIPGLHVISYEGLVKDPAGTLDRLGKWLGLTLRLPEPIYDGNAKYGE